MPSIVRYHVFVIVLMAIAAHGTLLLMDGLYWDDHFLLKDLVTKNWSHLKSWEVPAGQMFYPEFHRISALFPNIIAGYRALTFVFILLSALLCYMVCYESRMLSPWESLFISLIQMTFPAFRVNCILYMVTFLAGISLFLIAVYLALKSSNGVRWVSLVLRLLSLICFFFSFTAKSLLVLYLGFILLMIFSVRRRHNTSIVAAAKRYLPRHIDFLLLPLVFWFINELFFPRSGIYSSYNALRFSPKEQMIGFVRFIENAVLLQFNESLLKLLAIPALWLVFLVGIAPVRSRIGADRSEFFGSSSSSRSLIAFGTVLLVLAIIPYVLVGKVSPMLGWQTRFSLLISIGVSIITMGFMKLCFQKADGRISLAGWALLTSLVLASTVTMIQNNFSLQMRWIKEYSVQYHLKNMPPCPASTYWIDDHFPLPYDASSSERYENFEWVAIFNEAWGGESRIGVYPDLDFRSPRWEKSWFILSKYCYLTAYDPDGPQAKLTIRPGRNVEGINRPIGGTTDMVLWYWWYRHFNRRKFEWFVLSVTEVTLTMLPETSPAPGSTPSSD